MRNTFVLHLFLICCLLNASLAFADKVKDDAHPLIIGVPNVISNVIAEPELASLHISVTKAYRAIGKEVELFSAPAKRLAYMAERNNLDAELIRTSSYHEIHRNMLKVPVPLLTGGVYGVSLPKNEISLDKALLGNFVLGCLRGVILTNEFCEKGRSSIYANTMEQLIELLEKERIQLMIVASPLASRPFLRDRALSIHQPPLKQVNGYHFINQKHADLLPQLTEALKREFPSDN